MTTHAQPDDHLLDEIAAVVAELAALDAARERALERRDALIRQSLAASLSRTAIAEAAGLKEARLYQIRDGRR